MKTRQEQIRSKAKELGQKYFPDEANVWARGNIEAEYVESACIEMAEWADQHPQWYDAQGDNVPEYGREVIVIGRDGKVFYGHRPDPKEVTKVEGKPYHAKTYDKNGWNWPDIALWLDVEIPHELIEQITDKWFDENEQRRGNN